MEVLLFFVLLPFVNSFSILKRQHISTVTTQNKILRSSLQKYKFFNRESSLFQSSKIDENYESDEDISGTETLALAPSSSSSSTEGKEEEVMLIQANVASEVSTIDDLEITTSPSAAAATTTVMITNEMKRILIEELGYRRIDIECLRVELAAPIISKRIPCPSTGMPDSWKSNEEENSSQDRMLSKLKKESKYPLKTPLLVVSAILSGKGLTDAIVTLLKVNAGIRGASLTEEFLGFPVLGIDAVCVATGLGLGLWTFKTMK